MLGNGFAMVVGPAVVKDSANNTLQESVTGRNSYFKIICCHLCHNA
jgi:hypothetical protein